MPEIAYRSTHPDVLTHWEKTASAEAQNAWRETVETTLAGLGFPGRRWVTTNGLTDYQVSGVEHPGDEAIPDGWRRDKKLTDAIVPDRRRAAGKRIARQLAALDRPRPRKRLPGGMPGVTFGARALLQAGVARYGDAVYVTWSDELDNSDITNIDPAVWERIPLSVYYAALEHDEAKTNA